MSRLLLLLLVFVSACTPQPPPQPLPTPPSPDPCPTGVEYAVTGEDAAMGLRVMTLTLTNCGTETLQLNGYPSITLLDEDREPLTVAVGQGSFGISSETGLDAEPQPVTVAPGASATTGLLWRNTYDDTTAPPVVGVHLEIAVAVGQPSQVFTPVSPRGGPATLDLGSTGKVGVGPWTAAP